MKIFALYITVELKNKPKWFDALREKSDAWFDLHITLIQPRHIDSNQINDIKIRISKVLERHIIVDKKISFNRPIIQHENNKNLFMWFTDGGDKIKLFQKELLDSLRDYNNYCDEATRQYEVDFRPHITVAEDISEKQVKELETYLSSKAVCEGVILKLALTVVKNTSIKERRNQQNITMYDL